MSDLPIINNEPHEQPLPLCAEECPSICVQDVAVAYGGKKVLDGVTLQLPERGVTALIGPSGCGKTSFLNCLNRMCDLVPGCTVSGQIQVGDVNVLDPRTDVVGLRRRVGMIFQKPNPLPMSIRRNMELPLIEHGQRDRGRRDEIIERTLRDVGLWDEVHDRLSQSAMGLSGGQQQRLCLARALALAPQVLLLDEPCSALDPLATTLIEELIQKLGRDYAIVMVTHNLAQARRVADDVAVFWAEKGVGRMIEFGRAEQVFSQPQHEITRKYVSGLVG